MTPQTFSLEMCRLLSSLAPGFKGHYIYSKLGDEKIIVRCREDMEYWNSDYSIGDDIKIICPAWQVEDVLRNLHKILYCIVPGIEKIKVGQEIARLLFTHGDTAYQKIEEYLWSVIK